jgi:uncharacterized protein (TIGR00266 family)
MRWEVSPGHTYPVLRVALDAGEEVVAEAGAMLLMRGPVDVSTSSRGIMKGIMRALLGSESFFLNTFRSQGQAEVWLAPPAPGDIHYLPLEGQGYILQDTAYLAHHGEVEVDVAWRGFKGLLTEGELVWLRARGHGGVWVCAFGAIQEVHLAAGERVVVDNFHFVAMDEGARYQVRTFGGLKSFLLGGEGIVAEVEGPAMVLVQTRHLNSLAESLLPILKRQMKVR